MENQTNHPGMRGIDVSAYNVITDYHKVKKAGVQFAILKIIRKDLRPDKLFATHRNGFQSCGIPLLGVYNYSYAQTIEKAKTDAQTVVSYLKQYRLRTTVYLDVEDACQKNLGNTLISIINAYQEVIENNGYAFGLYTGMSFYHSYIKPYKSALKCGVEWIARYPGKSDRKITDPIPVSKKPDIGTGIEGWQYASTGIIDGIKGKVDLNIFYGNASADMGSPPAVSEIPINLPGIINTQSGNLNIRFAPDVSAAKVGFYSKGETVELLAKTSGNWYKTEKGYISGRYVTVL